MPRSSSHDSKGGATSERLERLGREMMPIFRKACAGCMCESDSTLANFCVRAENIPGYLLRRLIGWVEGPGTPDPRTPPPAERSKLLFHAGPNPRRCRRGLFPHGPARIAASLELKTWRLPWLRLPLVAALSQQI